MDKLYRDTALAGLTDQEIGEMVGLELRRRGLMGVMYAFPPQGGSGIFTAVVQGASELNAAQMLHMFAIYASQSVSETAIHIDQGERDARPN